MYEHRTHPLLSRAEFTKRVARHVMFAFFVLAVALGLGVVGYRYLGELEWLDALLNASMILGGMGPVDPLQKPVAKLFASDYALFSGLVFIGVASVLIAPFAHRLLHRFHLDDDKRKGQEEQQTKGKEQRAFSEENCIIKCYLKGTLGTSDPIIFSNV